jgi:hypothetical protein
MEIEEFQKTCYDIEQRMEKITKHTGYSAYDETTKLMHLSRAANISVYDLMSNIEKLHNEKINSQDKKD